MKNLSSNDIYQFSTIHNVDVQDLGENAVNDLILDMMTIIDAS